MTSVAAQEATQGREPPDYFSIIRERSAGRWAQLEADPGLAGPWRQLFLQVQSPRHVLSELLQNADDAGARHASVTIREGEFCYRHNGSDFTAEHFESLCGFGYSNKRVLHTIGFRGVGFKSTFSLGDSVEVHSPTLAVRFHKDRFTLPEWVDGPLVPDTVVRVRMCDSNREKDIQTNLNEWLESPASLLFFSNLEALTIGENTLRKEFIANGPVPRSHYVSLTGAEGREILVVRSDEESFPEEAMDEVRRERGTPDLALPPCRVELVLGLPGDSRLFVVLPTGVRPRLPFSCNAPFIQDPARMQIKDVSVSPTNRWLLRRLGALAAETLHLWLDNESLALSRRARAYDLLPSSTQGAPGDAVASEVCDAFATAVRAGRVLLNTEGAVSGATSCFAPPRELYTVWKPTPMLKSFGPTFKHLLAQEIDDHHRARLSQWNWIALASPDQIVGQLGEERFHPPHPGSSEAMHRLWQFIAERVPQDFAGTQRRRLAITPVSNSSVLWRADELVRVGQARRGLRDEDWALVLGHVRLVHEEWVQHVFTDGSDSCQSMLRALGLAETTPLSEIVAAAAASLFASQNVSRAECVRFSHVLAALDAEAPADMHYYTRDGRLRPASERLIASEFADEALVPSDWLETRLLHSDYAIMCGACEPGRWLEWSMGPRSRLCRFPTIRMIGTEPASRNEAERLLKARGIAPPASYRYKRSSLLFLDADWYQRLWKHWKEQADDNPDIWATVLSELLRSPASEWSPHVLATMHEKWGSASYSFACDPIPAQWVCRLRDLPCLPDTFGRPHVPAALLMRTPQTEPLLSVEPFVAADLDREETKPLLRMLGVRDTPAGAGSIIDRIKALTETRTPPLRELGKWYDALDRVLGRRRPNDLATIGERFLAERLIYTARGEWVTSDEVFQRLTDQDPPDLPVLHSDFASLAMWPVIGVADRPSAKLLLGYLNRWEPGRRLDGAELNRIRAIMPAHATRIWQECEHWLSLDGSWTPTTSLDFALFDHEAIRIRELFPAIKQRTADCRSVSGARTLPFCAPLRDLAASLEFRLSRREQDLPAPVPKPWLAALGEALARIELDGEQSTIREHGRRLAQTVWQPFTSLKVTPYLDGTPVGQAHEPVVLWDDRTLYVRRIPAARLMNPLVSELSRSFPGDALQLAIRSCFERDPTFVADYMESQFVLAPFERHHESSVASAPARDSEPDVPAHLLPDRDGGRPTGEPEASPHNPAAGDDFEATVTAPGALPLEGSGEPDPQAPPAPIPDAAPGRPEPAEPPRQSRAERAPPLIARFAAARGFRPDGDEFAHSDGTRLVESDGLFPWEHRRDGEILCRYWPAEACLATRGVELPAEHWEFMRRHAHTTALILLDDQGEPVVHRGGELVRMVEGGAIEVFAARLRLRRSP